MPTEKLKLAPNNAGIVRTLVEHIHYAVARAGTFGVYTDTQIIAVILLSRHIPERTQTTSTMTKAMNTLQKSD